MPGYTRQIDVAAWTLVKYVADGSASAEWPETETLRKALLGYLAVRYSRAHTVDRETAVDDALVEFLAAVRDGRVRAEGSPGKYLRVIAQRKLSKQRESVRLPDDLVDQDDAIARLLEADASKRIIEDAMWRARIARRYAVVRVVAAWLDLAERNGERPSSEEVAEKIGSDPAAVRQALGRFRVFLERAAEDSR